jgi:cysteine desulfurase
MNIKPIYLDYNATTPLDPAVVDAMLPYFREGFGNPSSTHAYGVAAKEAVEQARSQVAQLVGAKPGEIVFTGGGSEASNQAIKGVVFPLLFGLSGNEGCVRGWLGGGFLCRLRGLFRHPALSVHVITTAIEHPATLRPCGFLQSLGCRITVLPVDKYGVVDLEALRKALQQPTALVTIMHSNNEVGTLQPIQEIAKLAHEKGALVHTDVAQSLGKLPVDVRELGVDLLSIAGHKLYAPKGIGALYIREGGTLEPLIHGAAHEQGRRAGTENVPYIVALGKACQLARESLPAATERLRSLRERLWQRLQAELGNNVVLNGHPTERLPNTLNANFVGHIGAELLAKVPQIAASTGSACHEGQVMLSPVLEAMGVSPTLGQGALRLSIGRFTTEAEVDQAAEILIRAARVPLAGAA